jgi:hypothetical protein
MDSPRQPGKVRIESAEYDSGVRLRAALMKSKEVASIVRQQNTAFRDCESQDFGIRHRRVGHSGVARCEDIVAQAPQFHYYLERDVFVAVEAGQGVSGGLICMNLRIDLRRMSARVVPRIHKILRTQGRIGGQQSLLGGAQPPRLFEQPDGDAGPDDTRFTPTDVVARIDPGEGVTKILNYPLQDLRFLASR